MTRSHQKHGLRRPRRPRPNSPAYVPPYRDNEQVTDPSAKDGPLGIENELPEGGDSTRFPDHVREQLKRRKEKTA